LGWPNLVRQVIDALPRAQALDAPQLYWRQFACHVVVHLLVPVSDNMLKFRLWGSGVGAWVSPRTCFERWEIAYRVPDIDRLLEQIELRLEFFVGVRWAGQMSDPLGATRQEKGPASELRNTKICGVEYRRLDLVLEVVKKTRYFPAHGTFVCAKYLPHILNQNKSGVESLDKVKEDPHETIARVIQESVYSGDVLGKSLAGRPADQAVKFAAS
jgi:hypothetical protein